MNIIRRLFATPKRRIIIAVCLTLIIALLLLACSAQAAEPKKQPPPPASAKARDERQFIEFVVTDAGGNKFRPSVVPQAAMRLEGHIYINLAHVRRVYFQPNSNTADIHMQDAVLLVRFLNDDARAIFRAILSGTPYKAARETKDEVFKEVAAQTGLVLVAYVYELDKEK